MRILLVHIIFIFSSISVISQVTGYGGKRMIINSNLVQPIIEQGFGIGAEYAFARRLSGELDYSYTNRYYNGQKIGSSPDYIDEIIANSKIHRQLHTFKIGLKMYLNKGFNAPHGVYAVYRVGYVFFSETGIARTQNQYRVDIAQNYRHNNVKMFFGEAGIGKQWIIKKWITIDLGLGIFAGKHFEDKGLVKDRSGPNLFSFNELGAEFGFTLGIWGNLKLGILLPF